jgi:esterase/lipase superfamily enzyme
MIQPSVRFGALICTLALLLSVGQRAEGQATNSIVGSVSDNTGALLPNVTVTLINEDTGTKVQVRTDAAGNFHFDSVPVGRYSVSATVPGFAQLKREVQVVVGAAASVKFVFGLSTAPPPKEKNYVDMKVFYATDRKASGDTAPATFYTSQRNRKGALALGTCNVSIPRDHRIGELESPQWWKLQFHEDPNRDVVLLAVLPYSESKFYSELASDVGATKEKKAFVFVHGFDVTFEDAARRTAQLAYDLKFQGVPIFYSWPSRGELAGYPADEATIDWVKPHLKQFLEEVAARSNATSIYLIAHSMGNRALTGALQDIATEKRSNPVPHFREVVLAAPDIDADVFRQLAASIETASDRVTLYASSNDKALAASKDFHQYARAGESGPNLVVVKGIDTVDVSAIDTSFLGHSYIADNASVIADIYGLLAGTPAGRRTCLSVANFASLTYWLYGPPGVSGCPVPLPGP